MKKAFQNKYVVALAILAVAGTIVYLTTWANKSWLIEKIMDNGGVEDTADNRKSLSMKTAGALRTQLKQLM